jgi:hypothetical protein
VLDLHCHILPEVDDGAAWPGSAYGTGSLTSSQHRTATRRPLAGVSIDNELCFFDTLVDMGEEKTNMRNRRLLVRLRVPSMDKMVVAVELGREYLGRCLKLMLICGKIKQTMQGSGRVTIQNHHGSYIWIFSPTSIHRLVSLARVKDREDLRASGCQRIFESKAAEFLPGCVAAAP